MLIELHIPSLSPRLYRSACDVTIDKFCGKKIKFLQISPGVTRRLEEKAAALWGLQTMHSSDWVALNQRNGIK